MKSLLLVVFLILAGGTRHAAAQSEQETQTTKPAVRIVVIGHDTHGKSTLTSAITKVLSDEKRASFISYDKTASPSEIEVQGVRVKGTEVNYETIKQRYSLLDCHTDSDIKALLSSGKARFDGAILVVSAADGPMPQTREHILLARQAGIPSIVVYINKIDLVNDPELLQLVELEVRELLSSSGFPGDKATVIKGSAKTALSDRSRRNDKKSINDLLNAIDGAFERQEEPSGRRPSRRRPPD